jgi:hypothetical protein
MKRAGNVITGSESHCFTCSDKVSKDTLVYCVECSRSVCICCAAGFTAKLTKHETTTMITAYTSVARNFNCRICRELKSIKQNAYNEAWGVFSFFSTEVCSDEELQTASHYSFNQLTRRRFPNGSTAIMVALDNQENIVSAVGNYGGAWGPLADVNIFATTCLKEF